MLNLKSKTFNTLVEDELYATFLDALSMTACYHIGDYYYDHYINDISTKILTMSGLKQYLDNLPFIEDTETITINAELYESFTQESDYTAYVDACTAKGFTLEPSE